MDAEDLLAHTRQALAAGDYDQAAALARQRQTREVREAELHLAWADLLEELGLTAEVIQELNLALRDAPEREATYRRLAEVHLDQGRPDRAAQVWEALASRRPTDPEVYQAWGQALLEAGDLAGARQAWEAGQAQTGSELLAALIQDLERQPRPPAAATSEVLQPTPPQVAAFMALFAGREGVYARQWVSSSGETGYTPVPEPFTLKVAEAHIVGDFTVGIYPVRLDNTVNFLAFDFDLAKFAVRKAIGSQSAWQKLMERLHRIAVRLVDLAAAHELPVYLEDSGFKGRHAWIFLETPVPAGVAKKAGELLVKQLGPLPVEVTVEVFPKQTSVRGGGLGNLIKLPLGYHRRTGRRALFLQPGGEPYPRQLELLLQVHKAGRRAVYALIQRLSQTPAATPPPAAPAPEPPPPAEVPWREEAAPGPTPAATALPEVYHLETDAQYQFLLQHCPVLAALALQVEQSHRLSKDEALVLIHTLGHLEHGPAVVNELLQRCVTTDPTLLLKSRLRGHPMSCPKIRSRIPQVTAAVACNCQFELSGSLYPTPLLHLRQLSPAPPAPAPETLQFQTLLQDYLKLKQQQREVQLLLGRLEAQLAAVFQAAGVTEMQTALGRLRLEPDEQGQPRFILEL